MGRKKPVVDVKLYSYGEYSRWNRDSKELPKLVAMTDRIKGVEGTEFGYVLQIKKAKGRMLSFRIDHPSFSDGNGNVAEPFIGSFQIRKSDYMFFLGDSIWTPIEDKRGRWTMTTFIDKEKVATKTIYIL